MPTTKPRISINLPESEYAQLAAVAEKHKISMAWIGRKAIVDFLERQREDPIQLPLLFPVLTRSEAHELSPRSPGFEPNAKL
jgi:hypothetical protein